MLESVLLNQARQLTSGLFRLERSFRAIRIDLALLEHRRLRRRRDDRGVD